MQPLTLRAKNLPQPQSGQKNYECVVRMQGRQQRVPAVRFNSSSVQCQNASVSPSRGPALLQDPRLAVEGPIGASAGRRHNCSVVTRVSLSQYSYEGDEYGDTELDFSVVWDGDFPIDKPVTFRGAGQRGANVAGARRAGAGAGGNPLSGSLVPPAPHGHPQRCLLPAALLYKCWAQRPSCGLCLKADPRFNCGWCISERRCQLRAHCPAPKTNWMHPSQKGARCSHPRITQVSLAGPLLSARPPCVWAHLLACHPVPQIHPLMGPKEGGTRVTIMGENLGLSYREVGLRVAGVRCNSIPSEYVSAER